MKKMKQVFVLAFLLLCFFQNGNAQNPIDSLTRYYVKTKDKNIFYGRVMERAKRTILFETESVGTIRLKKRRIQYIERFRPELLIDSVYWPKYKFPHHNTFTPTGEIGETYYQNTLVYWNSFNCKFNDKMSIGGGVFPFFNNDFEGFTVWISPKVSIPLKSKKLKMSVGYFGLVGPSNNYVDVEQTSTRAGIIYGAISRGNEFYRINVGLGTGMADREFTKWPFYTISTMLRVKNRAFFRLEVMGGSDFGSYTNISYQILTRKVTWDIGWILPANKERIGYNFWGGPYFSALYTKKEY